jgi:hypothetical protein
MSVAIERNAIKERSQMPSSTRQMRKINSLFDRLLYIVEKGKEIDKKLDEDIDLCCENEFLEVMQDLIDLREDNETRMSFANKLLTRLEKFKEVEETWQKVLSREN